MCRACDERRIFTMSWVLIESDRALVRGSSKKKLATAQGWASVRRAGLRSRHTIFGVLVGVYRSYQNMPVPMSRSPGPWSEEAAERESRCGSYTRRKDSTLRATEGTLQRRAEKTQKPEEENRRANAFIQSTTETFHFRKMILSNTTFPSLPMYIVQVYHC